jgi:F-type H+-transporting ATPase subunit a
LWPFIKIGDLQLYVTESMLATWVVMAALAVFAVVVRVRLRKFQTVPKGFQTFVEMMIDGIEGMIRSMLGPGFERYGGVFFSMFAFILISNYTALAGLRPPTADLATTVALALTTFLMIHILGIRHGKRKYFREYLQPMPLFLPLNILGEITKPISLSFRLFGNIFAGVIIFGLVYEMFPLAMKFVIPGFLHAFFDFFVGALQAYVFTILSMAFIQQMAVFEE